MHQFIKFIFGIKLCMFRTVPLSIIRIFFTVHTADPYDIYHCCVHIEKNSWWWTEELSETCRVLFQK